MITFDPTITLGAIAQTLILMAGIVGGWIRLTAKISQIESDIKTLQLTSAGFSRALEQLTNILTQVAVQDVRILNVEKDIDELRHNKGFIE